jgi:hypothetical protein
MNNRPEKTQYDFLVLGTKVAESLERAANLQLEEAQKLVSDTKYLADGIRKEVEDHAVAMAAQHDRLVAFGEQIIEAHQRYKAPPPPAEEPPAPTDDDYGVPVAIERALANDTPRLANDTPTPRMPNTPHLFNIPKEQR